MHFKKSHGGHEVLFQRQLRSAGRVYVLLPSTQVLEKSTKYLVDLNGS